MNQQRVPYSAFETYVNRFSVTGILIRCNAMANASNARLVLAWDPQGCP